MDRQRQFQKAYSLGFPLLSDPDRKIAQQFGVRRRAKLPSKRATFVIGANRAVVKVIRSETNMLAHADEALEVLRSTALELSPEAE